jgi:hypothetical protein
VLLFLWSATAGVLLVPLLLLLLLLCLASTWRRTCQLSAAREAPTDQACMGLALLLSIMRQPAQHATQSGHIDLQQREHTPG